MAFNIDEDWRSAEWPKAPWMPPKYKSQAFMDWLAGRGMSLEGFRHLPMYLFAVDRGQIGLRGGGRLVVGDDMQLSVQGEGRIEDDEWLGAWPPDDPISQRARARAEALRQRTEQTQHPRK